MGLGIGTFVAFDAAMNTLHPLLGLDTLLPTQISGMLGACGFLCAASCVAPGHTSALHAALMPGVGWVTRWLTVFLVPVQVLLPTIQLPGGASEMVGFIALLSGGWLASFVLSARMVTGLQIFLPAGSLAATSSDSVQVASRPVSLRLAALWLFLAAATFPVAVGAEGSDDPRDQTQEQSITCFGRNVHLVSLGVGSFALSLQQRLPLLACFAACGSATIMGVAVVSAVRGVSFEQVVRKEYVVGTKGPFAGQAGDFLLWCLGPALVATGVQMFQFRSRIRALGAVLVGGCTLMSLFHILSAAAVAPHLGLSPEVALAGTIRCVTVPMALPIYARLCESADMQGNVALVALSAGISGIAGFACSKVVLGSALCRAPPGQTFVRGAATGTTGHALASAAFAGTESETFVWSMLAMATTGVASAAWVCSCPPVRDLVVSLSHGSRDV